MNSLLQNESNATACPVAPDEDTSKEESIFEFPATLAQRRFWLLHQWKPGGDPALNMTLTLRLRGPLDRDVLWNSLNEIVARHEALRTTFAPEPGELRQLISLVLTIDLPISEATNVTKENYAEFIEKAAREDAQQPFDIQAGPFVRARLLRIHETEHLLLLTIHRLVSDEWSNGVIVRELCACYTAFAQGRRPSLPELRIQFADYAHWQHERLVANDFSGQREYWQRQLAGDLLPLALPVDRSRLTNENGPRARHASVLSARHVDAAIALAARHGAAPMVVFLALFNALLYRHTGQSDFLVAVPGINREQEHLGSLVGPLANPLLLRANLLNRPTFLELIHRVGRTTLDAFANQDVPFESLLDDFQSPELPVSFAYRPPREEKWNLPAGLIAERLGTVRGGVLFPLNASVFSEGNATWFELEYDPTRFDRETIAQIVSDYGMLLRELISDPTRTIPVPIGAAVEKSRPQSRASWPAVVDPIEASEGVRPYLGLQLQLIAIWKDLLGVQEVGIRGNFFDLGGNPLLALRMLQRAERLCGRAILPAHFLANATVETLAAEIARAAIDESSKLLRVHEGGARTPFFYLHGDLFGGGFYTLKLSRALGTDQPFYVLPPLDVRDLPETPSIEQMATAHLQALRAVRPNGPYIIGGFCLGGIVAYELAQQILASGDQVEMLLVIDAEPQDKPLRELRRVCASLAPFFRWDEHSQINRFRQWALVRTKFAAWRKSSLRRKIRSAVRKIRNHAIPTTPARPATKSLPREERSWELNLPSTFLWAAAGYRPKPYRAPMVVFLSEDLVQRGDDLARAWKRLANKASVHPLKGSHLECIAAHVDTLAETIDSCLGELLTEPRVR